MLRMKSPGGVSVITAAILTVVYEYYTGRVIGSPAGSPPFGT